MTRKRSAPKYWVELKGILYARFQYKDDSGKTKVKYERISNKRSAKGVVEKLRSRLNEHGEEMFNAEKLRFSELADKYEASELIEAKYQAGVKVDGRRSVGAARSALKPLKEYFGKKQVQTIKPADIKTYKSVRLKTPVEILVNERTSILDEKTGKVKSVIVKVEKLDAETGKVSFVNKKILRSRERRMASINRELEMLRAIFNFAVMNEWLIKNPFSLLKGVISKAAEVERDRVLSFEEERRLLEVCIGRKAHVRPLLVCALDTAMRRGEIFKMKWRDINRGLTEILIPQTNTKSESSRTVGITQRLKAELDAMWEGGPKNLESRVFGITETIKTAFGSACEEAEIHDFRFHDCRHTATTRMIASGSSHTEVMKITGHTQLKTFLRYLNLTPETTRRVAGNLDGYIGASLQERESSVELLH